MNIPEIIERHIPKMEGWCTVKKATQLVNQILQVRPKVFVEIGVFGGRSLIPAALGIRANGDGMAYGIDPWKTEASPEGETVADNKGWGGGLQHHASHPG